ncbi:GNAT family N-acetyltransferase [Nonomuraea rubra]|uniref:RimJ/RimL family protein N-acetyltransferase n=1 Tax=Nonomuraea rubra TaxID=46180 RepID=A0A7X0NYK9_9ACTN|nr:GNAT family N-acetyltransferase [Nonomuraea rubra]MBB6552033.1 RimJ/RimL family protein N-acetyltransferase [Nonomuraea rubra]
MRFRPAVEDDLDRLLGCVVDDHISWSHPDRLLSFLESGDYRFDRVWLAEAEPGGEIMARAVWWGFPGGDRPLALDCLYAAPSVPDRVGLAAELLRRAHAAYGEQPAYHVFVGSGRRDDPRARAALAWRWEAAGRAGLTDELERLRYAWTAADAPVPEPSGRLVFRAEDDDEAFVAAFARVAAGTLDHHTRQAVAAMGPEAQAREDVGDYRAMPGERAWWRLAYDQAGELVGVALPSANHAGPVVGYLGVVPEKRGHGYAGDLLAEITRSHAGRGVQRIVADTDAGNGPMVRAFERAGYRNFATRLVLSANPVNT